MLPFLRKEVYTSFSMEEFSRLRTVLAQNQIDYDYEVRDQNTSTYGMGRVRTSGTLGQDASALKQYYLYVQKKDYDRALEIVSAERHGG